MPLPDERPRQSVANLIGRFEQQTKRQSVASSTPSRPTSVTSQHTGESAKAELKEKREWPPPLKPTTTGSTNGSEQVNSSSSVQERVAKPVLSGIVTTQQEVPASDPAPSPPETAVPVPKPPHTRQSSIGSNAATTRTPSTPTKNTSGRPSTATARTPVRTSAKSPPTSFHAAPSTSTSASTPARTSATAKSTSASTPARPRPSSRASHTPAKAPPARPKTPSASSIAHTPARPKTPASGLFAPTAASLAKARNAASPPPTPVRKPTAGPSVTERLSKPTAASLSKAVSSPAPTRGASAPRGATRAVTRGTTSRGAASVRGAPATRGVAARTRGATPGASTKTKVAAAAKGATPAAVELEHEVAVVEHHEHVEEAHEHVEEPEQLASPVEEHTGPEESHGQESSESTLIDEPESVSTGLTEEPGVHEAAEETVVAILNAKQEDLEAEVAEIVQGQVEEGDHVAGDKAESETTEAYDESHEEPPAASEESESAAESTAAEHEQEHEHEHDEHGETDPLAEEHAEPEGHDIGGEPELELENEPATADVASLNGKTTPTPIGRNGTDLEDIVNMLEAKPLRPMSIVSIPDEVMEIPDED